MPSESKNPDPFKELKWSDLQDWAGGKATAKGIKYQEEERVKEIKRTSEGGLVALVEGTIEYFTEVSLENGKLSSICTCPVGHNCKHGVAAVLEYLERIEQGEEVPVIAEENPLIARARRGYAGAEISDAYEAEESSRTLREYLEQIEKSELIEILMTFAKKDTMLGRYLRDRQNLASENPEEIIVGIYSELDELRRETGGYDFWSSEGEDVPDFSDVQVRLESLLDSGHSGELLDVGKELMDRYDGIAEYDEEGEIGTKISSCMDVVFRALSQSSLPAHEKLLYALDIELKDNYNILNEHLFWKEDFTPEEWRLFAEALKFRLKDAEKVNNLLYNSSWERDYVVDRLIDALKKAGLSEEVIPICELEAKRTGNYLRLVRELLDSGQKENAETWIYRGIKESREDKPGPAYELLQILLEIKENKGNWLFVAALETEEFFKFPRLTSYIGMRKAARKIGRWQEIREAALQYLRNGELPANKAKITEETSIFPDILPKTGLLKVDSLRKIKPPVLDLLIQIAIQENDTEEVVRWYKELKKSKGEAERYRNSVSENEIANAVKSKYPEIAIEIWKKLAEDLISETKVSSYEAASVYIRKVKQTLEAIEKKEEWEAYLRELREVNRRKRKLLQILDMLREDRIISE
ncbi:MAG TPA: SWIM zinc finger domain-containing protein [Methanosarcina barkeri]|nr:SWIM zinc finger domain-containing protein [Methanosarcina barkeri]